MTYKTDPFIPQQAESVADLVQKTGVGRGWSREDHIRDAAGSWHRLAQSSRERPEDANGRKIAGYWTRCRRFVPVAIARTKIGGPLTCERCAR